MHHIFTFTAKILASRCAELAVYLAEIRRAVPDHPDLPFGKLANVHFASIVIVPADADGFPAYLVFENNVDGTIAAHIETLATIAAPGLHRIFGACEGYAASEPDRTSLRDFLWRHLLRPRAAFVGNVGRDVGRIVRERALVDDVGREADRLLVRSQTPDSTGFYRALSDYVAASHPWALAPKGRLPRSLVFVRKLRAFALLPVALILSPAIVVAAIVLVIKERRDREDTATLSPAGTAAATQFEDQFHQNHFASISTVKPGWFRRTLLRVVLLLVDRLASLSIDGTLSGLDNIHFAHWVLVDDGRRLLFLTNYDGSWENYLDDFIDKAATGLTAIWSNVVGFPKTTLLVFGGATDERKFKTIARRTQIPTAVWYSAYLDLTVPTVDNDSAIRDGFACPPHGAELDRWLQRL